MKRVRFSPSRIGQMTLILTLLLGLAVPVLAQDGDGYAIDWWTVDAGGGRLDGTGSGYALRGTAGQPEPGPTLTGGGYTLVGGYWAGASGSSTPQSYLYLPVVMRDA